MKCLKALLLLVLLHAPAVFAADVIVLWSESSIERRPVASFLKQEGIQVKTVSVGQFTDLFGVDKVLEAEDRIVGIFISAHGNPKTIFIGKRPVTGGSFADAMKMALRSMRKKLGSKFFIHLQSCSLSGSCSKGERNFVAEFAPEMIEFAREIQREVLVTSFDYSTADISLAANQYVKDSNAEFSKKGLGERILAYPILRAFDLIAWTSSPRTYAALEKKPFLKAMTLLGTRIGNGWVKALAVSLGAYAITQSLDGYSMTTAAATFLSLKALSTVGFTRARVTSEGASGQLEVEHGHIEELFGKILVKVRSAPPAEPEPFCEEDLRGF